MPSKISTLTPVLQADLDDTAALEVTNRLGQTRKSTIAQLRTAIVAGVLVAAHLTSPVIDSGGLTITSGTLGAQAVTATALTVTPGATSVQALTAGATSVTTLAGTGAITGFTSLTLNGAVAGVTTLAGSGAVTGFTTSTWGGLLTVTTGGLTVSSGTTTVQALTASGQISSSLTGATPAVVIGDGTTTAAFARVRAPAGTGGAIEFMEGTATILWDIGKDYNGGTRAFTIRDAIGGKDAISIASNSGAIDFASHIGVPSASKVYLNGVGGSAWLYESSAGVVRIVVAGSTSHFILGLAGAGSVALPSIGTTASAANAFFDNAANNNLLRSTSSLRFKQVESGVSLDDARVIMRGLDAFWYNSKADGDLINGEINRSRWFVGFAAETAARIPETRGALHTVDEKGDPNWFQYERMGPIHNVVLNDHESRIVDLESFRTRAIKQYPDLAASAGE